MPTNGGSGTGSFWVRWQLGLKLKRLREEAGKTLADVEVAEIASTSKMYRIEAGKISTKPADIYALARIYDLDNDVTDALVNLARGTKDSDWFEEYGEALPDWLGLLAGMEGAASQILTYDPNLVVGLLQTPAYARAVIRTDPVLDERTVEARLAFRMERQDTVLKRGPAGRVLAVLGAGALSLVVGSPDVMSEQVAHLCEISRSGVAEVRVRPWRMGPHKSMNGPFTLMDFEGLESPAVVSVETFFGSRYQERLSVVKRFRDLFTTITDTSIPIEEYMS